MALYPPIRFWRRSTSSTPTSTQPSTGASTAPLGLRLLRDVAVAWQDLGRAGDAMSAADRLLTDDNAQRYSSEWLTAAWRTSELSLCAGTAEVMPLLERIEAVAAERGDEYYRRLARWPKESAVTDATWRDLARQQPDRYMQAFVPVLLAWNLADDEPAAAVPAVIEADAVAAASGMRSFREMATRSSRVGMFDRRSRHRHRTKPGRPAGSMVTVVARRHPLAELRGTAR